MASTISFNGSSYSIPAEGDSGWGSNLSSYLIAIASGALQKTGGTFALTSEVDFGSTFGAKLAYLKSQAANPSSSGIIRLGNNESIKWRNAANNADLDLTVNASNILQFNGSAVTYSGSIVNADISASAAIAYSKLAALTVSRALQTNSSTGFVEVSSVTSTELSYLSGVTSAIQTQINAKQNSSTAVTLTGSQILTNKTLTSPVINSPTGLVKADVGLGSVDNTSDATKNAAVATLANKTLTSPTLTTPVIDIPTFIDQSSSPSAPSSGRRKIYSKTNGKVYHLDSAGVERELGSGGTGVNFITGGDAEGGSIFATYKDSSSAVPSDGTGGVPTISSATTTSTNPLSGANSFLLTHPASNVQGEGWSVDFTIDNANKAKVLKVEFDYLVDSGTFVAGSSGVDSDVEVYIYDVTNAQIIQPSSYKLLSKSTTIADHFSATFQTSSSSTSYRLIFHCATTSASSFVLKVDSVSVSPSQYVYGTPITDWAAWTPTGSWSTNTTYTGLKRRVGDEYEYQVKVLTSGAPTSAALTINIAETIDLNKLIQGGSAFENLGTGAANDSGTAYTLIVAGSSANAVQVRYQSATTGASSQVTQASPFTFGASDYVTVYFRVPILGLSSSVQMSDQTDTRIVSFSGGKSGGSQAVTGLSTDITFASEKDTHGGWSGSTYVVKVPGDYIVNATVYSVASAANILVYKNSASYTGILNSPANTYTSGCAFLPNLVVGDVISLRASTSITIAGDSTIKFGISRISGPSAIAATESVNARYTNSSTSISGQTTVVWTNKDFDSHGAMSSGVYTIQSPGKYQVNSQLFVTATYTVGNALDLIIQKNSTDYSRSRITAPTVSGGIQVWVSDIVNCVAGDTIRIQVSTAGATPSIVSSTVANYVSIARVGN